MWHAVTAGFLFFVLVFSAGGGRAQAQAPLCSTTGVLNGAALADFIDCQANGLTQVWREDMRPTLMAFLPHGEVLKDVDLSHHEECDWRPAFVATDGSPHIRYGKTLLYYSLVLQQAQFLYFAGDPAVQDPGTIISYLEEELLPVLRREHSLCVRRGPAERGYPRVPIPSILYKSVGDGDAYAALMDRYRRQPGMDLLQAYTGGLPIFFAVLHEVGHAVLHRGVSPNTRAMEFEADRFAAKMFQENDVPVALGLGHFQIFYGHNMQQAAPEIACRLARLAKDYPTSIAFRTDFGPEIFGRLERLRVAFGDLYGARCEAA